MAVPEGGLSPHGEHRPEAQDKAPQKKEARPVTGHDQLIAQAEEDLTKINEAAAQVASANLGKMDLSMVLSIINVRSQCVQALALAKMAKLADERKGFDLGALQRN
jgi:hypothetical protein